MRAGRGRRRSPAGGRAPRRAGVSTLGAAASTPRRWVLGRCVACRVCAARPAALRCVSRVYSQGSPRSTRCGTFIVFVCGPDRMHQLTQSSEPQGPQMHTRRAHTRPRPPHPQKTTCHTRPTPIYAFTARVVWSRVTESSSFANKQHAWAHGEHHATRPCSPSVLPRIPPPFDAPPKIDAGLLSSQFSTPVGCVACTGGELWGGDVSV